MVGQRHDNWMPFYIGDYLKDTPHLDRALHGSYLLLIMACWTANGELPDDDRQLALIAKASPKEWKADRAILQPFFIVGEGVWRHKRVTRELDRALSLTEKRRNAGGKGAAKRWQDHSKDDGNEMAQPSETIANASQPEWQNDGPLPLPLQSKKESASPSLAPHERARVRGSNIDPGIEEFEPEGAHAPNPTAVKPFLRRHLQQQPIPPSWQPTQHDVQRFRAEWVHTGNPDLTDDRIAQRTFEFHNWCASKGVTSHNPASEWLNFMVKTNVSKSPSQGDEFDDPGTRAIAAAVARRYPNG